MLKWAAESGGGGGVCVCEGGGGGGVSGKLTLPHHMQETR